MKKATKIALILFIASACLLGSMIFTMSLLVGYAEEETKIDTRELCKSIRSVAESIDIPEQEPPDEGIIEEVIEEPAPVIEEEEKVVQTTVPYTITEEEILMMAQVTMAEAEAEPEYGQRLVIDTMLNRLDNSAFGGKTITDILTAPNQYSYGNDRYYRCYPREDLVELVRQEIANRTDYNVVFFVAGQYSQYGTPMFQVCCHYFSSH